MYKKVMFWLAVVFAVGIPFAGATAVQLLPFGIFIGLAMLNLWGKKDTAVAIVVLSAIMLFINVAAFSLPDIIFWVLAGLAFLKKDVPVTKK